VPSTMAATSSMNVSSTASTAAIAV
jgi:hypothetical protein